jgi:hypothetical protein
MRASIGPSTISRISAAVAGLWLCGAGSAWAGGSGESLTTVQNVITGICMFFNLSSCPQLPTVTTQAVLVLAALENSPPEMVRALNNIPPGSGIDAGNAAAVPPTPFPLTTTTSPTLSGFLSTLTPLAFISSQQGTPATPAQLYNSAANTFLYVVASGTTVASTGLTEPVTLDLFYEDLSRTNSTFVNGQIVAKFSVPLTAMNGDGNAVITTLEVLATCTGGPSCLQAYAVGGIGTPAKPIAVSDLGISFALEFSPSLISTQPHAIFEFAVPQLVTALTDPLYFWFANNFGATGPINLAIPSAFFSDDDGSCPGHSTLGCIGITPSPAPLVSNGLPTFVFCASLPDNSNGPGHIFPAVSAHYAMATDGETLISRALSSISVCPF